MSSSALSYAAIAKGSATAQPKSEPPAPQQAPPMMQPLPPQVVVPTPVTAATQPVQPVPAARPSTVYTLHFGDLHVDVTNQFLTSILKEVGVIENVKVCRERVSRKSLGYAYVNFREKADADRCIEKLNYMAILGQPVRITRLVRDREALKSQKGNIFIKGLCKTIDLRTLHHTFSQFGPVMSCKILPNESGQTNIAFVQFESADDAQRAINDVDGKYVDGSRVSVSFFIPRSARDSPDPDKTYLNLYVKPLSKTLTEEQFKTFFSKFGVIGSCRLRMEGDECKGFGFVAFTEHAMAKAAAEATNGKVIPGLSADATTPLYVARLQTKVERQRAMDAKYKKLLQDREKFENLYVKNLGNDVDDAKLLEVFSQFGQITSAVVQKDENRATKGFGYVSFVDKEAANKAIEKLDKAEGILGPKPLYVGKFQPKELRQQHQYDMSGVTNQMPQMMMWGPMAGMMPWSMQWSGGRGMMPFGGPAGGRGGGMMFQQFHGGRGAPWGGQWPQQQAGRGVGGMMLGAGGRPMAPPYPMQPPHRQAVGGPPMPPQQQDARAELLGDLLKYDELSRRQSLGENLHPLVEDAVRAAGRDSTVADKVTGMLIDLDIEEVVSLILEQTKLLEKVKEAIALLDNQEPQ